MSRASPSFAGGARQGGDRAFAVSIDELKALGGAQIRAIAAECLPNGRPDGIYWRTGSIADEPGQSLAVTLDGADRGLWCDHAASGPEGGGNVLQLIAWTRFGGDIKAAIAWLKSFLGLDGLDPGRLATVRAQARRQAVDGAEKQARQREDRRRSAHALFLSAAPIAGTPAELYLRGRGIDLRILGRAPGSLRFRADVYNKEAARALPCLLAAVVDLDGRHIATHRIWIAPDSKGGWTKADLENAKMALGSFAGGFIPLWKGRCPKAMGELAPGTDVYVSEGIEDGLSTACASPEQRVIAAVTLGNIGKLRLPEGMGRLIIVGQRYKPGPETDALEAAIVAQQAGGRDVWLTPPPAGFKDVNDALRAVA